MKPYVETIPGTDVKFEMVPIPGGTFVMGSPRERGEARRGRRAAAPGRDRPVLDGQVRGHLGRIRPVRLLARPEEEEPREGRPHQAARDREEGRRRHPPDPALRRRDLRLRPQRPAGHLHHPPRGHGILPLALGQDRQDLPPADRGRVGIRLPRRHQDRLLLGRRPEKLDDYAWYVDNAEKPRRSARRSPTPGASTTSTATSPSGAWTTTSPTPTSSSPTDKPTLGPVILPDAKEYPYVARGGSWDDDADQLRSAARRGSNPEWSVQDPQRPQSIWWHTDATFVGFRSSGRSSEQENLKGLKSQVVKGKEHPLSGRRTIVAIEPS